jgi:hypothetical protein
MSTPAPNRLQEIAAAWRSARRVYPIYAALIAKFGMPVEPCRHLESPVDKADPEVLAQVQLWLERADAAAETSQLRKLLQSEPIGNESSMRTLAQRYLTKPNATKEYRDKIEFLLAQYFSHSAPLPVIRGAVTSQEVAHVLEPVIGAAEGAPSWLSQLDELITKLNKCDSLQQMLGERLLEKGRELKTRAAEEMLQPPVLVAFTRYNFLVRRAFIRMLHNDLERIRRTTDELQRRGVETVNCKGAGLNENASIEEVRRYCRNWKAIFRTDYSERSVCDAVVQVLGACEQALANAPKETPAPTVPVQVVAESSKIVSTHAVEPKANPSEAKEPAARPIGFSIDFTIQTIAEQLYAAQLQNVKLAVGSIVLGSTKSLLSSWEVAAFLKATDATADALQKAVSARVIVQESLGRLKQGEPAPDISSALEIGHAEAARLQEQIAQARDSRNIDAAVNLAASQKRLLQILDEAHKHQGAGQ